MSLPILSWLFRIRFLSKKSYYYLFVLLLLAILTLSLVFRQRIQEPYPGLFQPAFEQTSPRGTTLKTASIELIATTSSGESLVLDYSHLFFPAQNYGYFFYTKIPDKDPRLALSSPSSDSSSQASRFYRYFVHPYVQAIERKRVKQYDSLRRYLERNAELLTKRDIISVRFERYDVIRSREEKRIDSVLVGVTKVKFE